MGALLIQTLTTTIYTVGIPPETTLLFKALVVTAVCLMQSPAFRAKVLSGRRRGSTRAGGDPQGPARGSSAKEATAEVSA